GHPDRAAYHPRRRRVVRRARPGRRVRVPHRRADPGRRTGRRRPHRSLPGTGGATARRLAPGGRAPRDPGGVTVAGPDWHAEWVAALDALELDVSAAEALLTRDRIARDRPRPQPWRPPAGLGPLPLDLRPRADVILTRQLAVAE